MLLREVALSRRKLYTKVWEHFWRDIISLQRSGSLAAGFELQSFWDSCYLCLPPPPLPARPEASQLRAGSVTCCHQNQSAGRPDVGSSFFLQSGCRCAQRGREASDELGRGIGHEITVSNRRCHQEDCAMQESVPESFLLVGLSNSSSLWQRCMWVESQFLSFSSSLCARAKNDKPD